MCPAGARRLFSETGPRESGSISSSDQRARTICCAGIRLLTGRYHLAVVEATPVAEIRIGRDGELVLTGVDPLELERR
jgi:hypothetical protein